MFNQSYRDFAAKAKAAKRAASRGSVREPDPMSVTLTTGDDFAHQGHRLDIADERLISHREARWIDGRRYEWKPLYPNGPSVWVKSPDLHRTADPQPKPVNPVRDARRTNPEHYDGKLLGLVDRIVEAGGRPEDAQLIVNRRLGRPVVRPHVKRIVAVKSWVVPT